MHDSYEIELRLKSNWANILDRQSKQFEGFIQKTTTATGRLEKSITGMQTNLAKTYEGMFVGSQKKVQELVNFSNYALQNVSASTQRMFSRIETLQNQVGKAIDENKIKLEKYTKAAADARKKAALSIPGGKLEKGFMATAKKAETDAAALDDKITALVKHSDSVLTKALADHFNILADSIKRKSNAVNKSTKLLIDNSLSQFNRLKSQGGFKGAAADMSDQAGGIVQLERQAKQVYANLAQLREARKTAENVLRNQTVLASQQTNEKLKAHHEELAKTATKTLKQIAKQQIETAKAAKTFTAEIAKQKDILSRSGGLKDIQAGWKSQLKVSNVKALMEPIISNIEKSGELAGKGFLGNLVKNIKQGDKLRGSLDAFKNKIAEIKQQAGLLVKAGLVDPNSVVPKIQKVENALKEYEVQIKKTRQEYAKFSPKGRSAFKMDDIGDVAKMRKGIRALTNELGKSGKITKENFEVTYKNIQKMETALEQHAQARKRLEGKINTIKAEAVRIREKLADTENQKLRSSMISYLKRLRGYATEIREELNKSMLIDTSKLNRYKAILLTSVKKTMAEVRAITSGKTFGGTPDKLFGNLKKQYEALSREIDKLKTKRFVSSASIEEGKKKVQSLKDDVISYKKVLTALVEEYKRLQRIQRAGVTGKGIRQQKALLKEQITDMRSHMAEVQRMSHHASRRIEQVQASSLKGFLRRSWEMVRNFRWQVAAVIYLVSRAIQAVKRVFMDTMNEIAKFRRDSMALAAQYSFKMFGDMKENFSNAYKFSRDLMMKLEIVAAETILTLDDMLMLTKTFAQAGIIPRTDEDLQRIATIGTAIKALTEGMANAGVQMKQELYAIIAGRQRATDQLAMMFKLMGKDIQQMIDDGKAKGKEMIEVLADALKPFSVMNNALKDEWEAVINKLQIVWKMLKRFALEDSLLQSTKTLKAFIEEFWNKTEGLTEKGRAAAAVLRAGFELVKAVVIGIWNGWKQIFITLGSVVNLTMSMVGLTSQVEGNVEATKSGMKGLLQLFEGLLKVTWLFSETIKMVWITINAIIAPINYIVQAIKAAGSYAGSWALSIASVFAFTNKTRQAFQDAAKAQKELADVTLSAANKRMDDAGDAIWNMLKNADKGYQDIEKTIADILEKLKEVNKENAKLGQEFKLTYSTGVFDEWAKMQNEMQRAEAAQFKGPKRFEIEAQQKIDALDELKLKTNKNIQDLTEMFAAYHSGVLKMTKEQAVEMQRSWDAHTDVLGGVLQYEQWIRNEQFRLTDEWNKKEEISLARRKRKYEQFMRDVSQTPMTPKEKAKDWFDQKKIDLKELIISSEFFRNNIEEVDKALEKGLKLREDNAIKQMNLEAEKFINKASKANAWNTVFDELNTEFAEYVRQIEKSNDLDKEKKEELRKQLEIIKAQRAEQEKLNIAYESYLAQLDVQIKKASFLKGSYSPIKQRQGEIMELRVTYQKEMAQMGKALDEFNKKWKEQGDWSKDATEDIKAQGKAMEESMKSLTAATERELKKKQFPIWNDLVEASNQWADGFTDALSEIINGVDSVTEALDALQKQILQDTLKIVIKRTITDNLQDMLGNEGVIGKMFGVKGKKEKVMEITAKKPLPVYITNSGGTVPGAEGAGKIGKELGKGSSLGKPMPVFVTNQCCMGGVPGSTAAEGVKGVSQDLADISAEIAENTKEVEASSDSWVDKMKDGFSDIGNKIMSWVNSMNSSGGGGSGGGGGSWWSSLTSWFGSLGGGGGGSSAGTSTIRGGQGGGYGFAEGGTITEPIIGKGLKSGEVYNFGEKTKYGENEIVAPMKKMQKVSGSSKIEYHMPIHLSAIDTQSGIQFLVKHSDVIQGQMVRNLKQNKPIRKGIQNAY